MVRVDAVGLSGLTKREVAAWARKTSKILEREDDDLAVVFVTPTKIKRLNREYRGKDFPTDVLSFPSDAKGDLGDIFIAPAVAKKKAALAGMGEREYLILLIVHSVLHLGGFDHHTAKDSRAMEKMEKKVLK